MGKIAIVTDSTANLTDDLLDNLYMIPLQVRINNQEYKDRVEISPEEFFNQLEASEEIPTTSQPPVGGFVELYQKLLEEYDHIISIHISKGLSGTVKAANLAANMVDGDVKVIDSETVSASLGILARELAKEAQQNNNVDQLLTLASDLKEEIGLYFTVDDLTHLEKGGRIGKASALIGNLFNISPLLTLEEGKVVPYKKIRGERRLYNTFKKLAAKKLDGNQGTELVILYGNYLDKATKLKEIMTKEFNWEQVSMFQIGSVVGSHTGPTPFGIVVYK